jgi:hypothetical protein
LQQLFCAKWQLGVYNPTDFDTVKHVHCEHGSCICMSDDRDAFCRWTRDQGVLKCSRCGRTVAFVAGYRDPLAICPNGHLNIGDGITVGEMHQDHPKARHGLGDMVAAGLSAVGITKKRVSALVGGDCGCQQRQEALNELGRKIGIG